MGKKKKVEIKTNAEQNNEAICERPPTSALIRDLVIEPYAGSRPGKNEDTMLPAPRATNSRFGEIEYPNRCAFCFAATMLSRNPMTVIKLGREEERLSPGKTTLLSKKRVHCRGRGVLEISQRGLSNWKHDESSV